MAQESNKNNAERAFVQRYLAPLAHDEAGAFSLQDDCAALSVEAGYQLIATVDAVAEGVHFFADDDPADIAWKAVAVNVSDLAAKGAAPSAYLMSLAFPKVPDDAWMQDFVAGLQQAQSAFSPSAFSQSDFSMRLIGGDTDVRAGPLTITITAFGQMPTGTMVRRSGGRPGDRLFVTGTIGDSFLGLQLRGDKDCAVAATDFLDEDRQALLERYLRPAPRVQLHRAVQQMASASIDVSDGLVKDISTLATASGLGAEINASNVPLSQAARKLLQQDRVTLGDLLTGGGDYEVVAAVGQSQVDAFCAAARSAGVSVSDIGALTPGTDVTVKDATGTVPAFTASGYDHFTKSK